MTIEELKKQIDDMNSSFSRQLKDVRELIRRHNHDNIETDRLPFSSLKDWGTNEQILTSRGPTLPPEWNLPGVSPSSSMSASRSPSASMSPSASLSPSASPSP